LTLMVSVDELDDFIANTLALLRRDPCQVRFVLKYRHCGGSVCCKVTDESTCFTFESKDVRIVKKLEVMNSLFFTS